MIYFISDTHFNHDNIIKYCNRPFKTVQEMNNAIIDNWKITVKDEDIIYHLGDVAFGNRESAFALIKQLKGKKYLIRGNHDRWSIELYQKLGFTVLKNAPIRLDEHKLLLSHIPVPDKQIPEGFVNIHGHIHDKKLYECVEKYESSEYSLEKHINISCDVTNFKPIGLDELKQKKII